MSESKTNKEFPHIKKDTVIKVCNAKKTKCDSIVVLFNDAPPVVTLTNAKSTNATIDYITIEEQKDDKIYVNKKDNEITVTVRDTVHKTEKRFNIDVTLDTIKTKDIKKDFVTMRTGGASNAGIGSRKQIMKEHLRALKAHGVHSNIFLLSLRYIYKLHEFFKN